MQYILVSVADSSRSDKYIWFRRFCSILPTFLVAEAGRYDKGHVMQDLDYYNNGISTIAVPVEIVEWIAASGDGESLPNTVATWNRLIKNAIAVPALPVRYRCKYSRHKDIPACFS